MKCNIDIKEDRALFTFILEEHADDVQIRGRATLAHPDFQVTADLTGTHSDLIVLIAIFGVQPWIGNRLDVNISCSRKFADAVEKSLGFELTNVDDELKSREAPANGRPAMAYSGGADCSAALALLPDDTAAYFLDRVPRQGDKWAGIYSKKAAYHSCDELEKRGYLVRRVETDVEFIRQPVGFPNDLSNIIPALCWADADGLDAIGWGAVFESTYRVGSTAFRDYARSPFMYTFSPIFEAVGLAMVNPVAGVSEVGTAMISKASGFGEFAQSCMRGDIGRPCMNCWKCARKVTLDGALTGNWPSSEELDKLCSSREARLRFTENPIKHEIVVAFSVGRYTNGEGHDSVVLGALREKLASHSVDYLTRYYPPANEFLPEKYRPGIEARLELFMDPMTPQEVEQIQNWSIRDHLSANRRVAGNERLAWLYENWEF